MSVENNPKKILIVRPDALGDLILTLPIIDALQTRYPDADIHILAQPYLSQIIPLTIKAANQPFFKLLQDIKNEHYDIAILPYLTTTYSLLTLLAGIPIRIGDANKLIPALFLTKAIPLRYQNLQYHVVEHNLKLISEEGIPEKKLHLKEAPTDIPTQPYCVIQPCTGGSDREWAVENYVGVINYLKTHHPEYRVVLTGAGKHEEEVMDLIDIQSHTRHQRLSGHGTLAQLVTLLRSASLVIGTNTGPLHVAARLERPIISLFLSPHIKPLQWHPWKTQHISCLDNETDVCKAVTQLVSKKNITEKEMHLDDTKKSHTLLVYGDAQPVAISNLKIISLPKAHFWQRYHLIKKHNVTLIYLPQKYMLWPWIVLKYLTSLSLYVPPQIKRTSQQIKFLFDGAA